MFIVVFKNYARVFPSGGVTGVWNTIRVLKKILTTKKVPWPSSKGCAQHQNVYIWVTLWIIPIKFIYICVFHVSKGIYLDGQTRPLFLTKHRTTLLFYLIAMSETNLLMVFFPQSSSSLSYARQFNTTGKGNTKWGNNLWEQKCNIPPREPPAFALTFHIWLSHFISVKERKHFMNLSNFRGLKDGL